MSCFIAIPSEKDHHGFKRVERDWDTSQQFLHILPGGKTAFVEEMSSKCIGLLIVPQEFMKSDTAKATKLLMNGEVEGIFLHPGGRNQPGEETLNHFVVGLPDSLKPIRAKLAAFTDRGDFDFQVPCLKTVWNWLKDYPDGETEIRNLDLGNLDDEFKRLQWLGGTALRINTLLLQCWKIQALYSKTEPVNGETRAKWLAELMTWFGGNDAATVATLQILSDPEICKAGEAFRTHLKKLEALPPDRMPSIPHVSTDFIEAVRRYIKTHRPQNL